MGLDVCLERVQPTVVFSDNYTHNCGKMADAAGIYYHLWRPEEIGIHKASQLIGPLTEGIKRMEANPDAFIALNPANGWGSYDTFLPWVRRYLEACREYPDATVRASR